LNEMIGLALTNIRATLLQNVVDCRWIISSQN
jgi:hypothetical protein